MTQEPISTYFPLHCHSQYSLQDGLPSAEKMAARIRKLNLPGCAITDHGNLYGVVEFVDGMNHEDETDPKKRIKKKPIIGCELYIRDNNLAEEKGKAKTTHLVVLAKNFDGWKTLVKLVSLSNHPENNGRKPMLTLGQIKEHNKGQNLIAFSGHPGSKLANCLFMPDIVNLIYMPKYEYKHIKMALKDRWKESAREEIVKFHDVFGKDNFFLEINLIDKDRLPCELVITECLRELAEEDGLRKLATPDAHYPEKEDCYDQRVLLCSGMQTTLPEIESRIAGGQEVGMGCFFRSNNYHIPSFEEMRVLHTDDELRNTLIVAEMCKNYTIFSKPKLPQFITPNGQSSIDYFKELCRAGWKSLIQSKIPKKDHNIYAERVKKELDVIEDAGLADYFLIVIDIINFIRSKGYIPGPGRGSAAGCLVSYLTGIIRINPIKYGLIFERFYNNGRNIPNHIPFDELGLSAFEAKSLPKDISDLPYVKERLEQIKDNQFYKEEIQVLSSKRTLNYYNHIIKHLAIDSSNPHNSYIMWACGKTDTIDTLSSAKVKPGKTSMPDIDIDMPAHIREEVIEYIKGKYGEKRVGQIVTFQSMQGRRAIKDVFRAYGGVPADLLNQITKPIPDKSKIADDLQEMEEEEEGESSIIKWALENRRKQLEEYAYLDDDGEIKGTFSKRFEQAIRLEGTKCNKSKHASGLIISSVDLDEICPMVLDKETGAMLAAMEMNSLEKIGLIKFDVLGVSVLTKLMTVRDMLGGVDE